MTPHRLTLIATLICAAAIADPRASSADDELRRRFLEEYPAAHERLREFYSNLRMVATVASPVEQINRQQEPPVVERIEWRLLHVDFFATGDWLRVDISSGRSRRSNAVGPDLVFDVGYDEESGRPFISRALPRADREASDGRIGSVQNRFPLAFIPYQLGTHSLLEIISAEGFRVTHAEREERVDGPVVHVDWQGMAPGDEGRAPRPRYGRFTFLPESSWALRYSEILMDLEHPETGIIVSNGEFCDVEYEGERDGIPLLKGMTHWRGLPGMPRPRKTYQVIELIPGPLPEETFTPEAFGLPPVPAP